MAKITLDADTFRALASSTRLTVLKALDERRKTLTELSRDLALNKATVHEHMQLLTAAGLVRKRDDEGRKWIYYELTWTGQRILHPEATTTFNLLLGLSTAAAGGGVFMLGRALGWWFNERSAATADEFADPESQALQSDKSAEAEPSASSPEGGAGGDADANETDRAFAFDDSAGSPDDGSDAGTPFFDDGGWLALALIASCVLFIVLAYFMQRKLRPKPLDPAAAAAAEAAFGDPAR
ncbi:MAG TPA: helix-turn-helix domain-containing protein [Candidatus Thermoplasmatota archaeon]|nr:helix-turn-helix domain-containing protein [Candidatus Thermoplasmatota archaeon]